MSAKQNENYHRNMNDSFETPNEISVWNKERVSDWLRENNFSQYIDTFRNNNINGYDLCQLTSQDLQKELNIANFHDRFSLLRSIRENLLKQCKSQI